MIVMQYANNGNLLSYLVQNINKLMWMDKLQCLEGIAYDLEHIHYHQLVHCDLHSGNIVLHDDDGLQSFICDLGLSRSINSHNSSIRGVLPFIALHRSFFRNILFTAPLVKKDTAPIYKLNSLLPLR